MSTLRPWSLSCKLHQRLLRKKSKFGTYELNKRGRAWENIQPSSRKEWGGLLIFRVNEDSHPEVSTLGLTDTCWRQRGPPNRAWLGGACEGSPGGCGSGEGASEQEGRKTGRASRCSSRPAVVSPSLRPRVSQPPGVQSSAAMQKRSPPLLPAQLVPTDA